MTFHSLTHARAVVEERAGVPVSYHTLRNHGLKGEGFLIRRTGGGRLVMSAADIEAATEFFRPTPIS